MIRPMLPDLPPPDLHQAIRALLLSARAQVRQTVNTAMMQTYWQIGRMIVEDEQGGQKRAAYGKQVLPDLAKRLSEEFGAGFDVSNLRNMRRLFLAFPIRAGLERAGVGAKRRMRQVGRSRRCVSMEARPSLLRRRGEIASSLRSSQ